MSKRMGIVILVVAVLGIVATMAFREVLSQRAELTKVRAELVQSNSLNRKMPPKARSLTSILNVQPESRATKMNRENRALLTMEQNLDLVRLYQIVQKGGTNQSAKVALDQMIAKYPNAYRTGTTVLDMAEREKGAERVKYLKLAIKDFSDCLYWDGTEVGMKAKSLLTAYENSHRE